ncbi:MAG: hypothetical protein WCW30_02185, partial [Candidatus Gracilibacteria bacterium]
MEEVAGGKDVLTLTPKAFLARGRGFLRIFGGKRERKIFVNIFKDTHGAPAECAGEDHGISANYGKFNMWL